jgi:uncharacterized protein with gpF-like domain
MAVKHRKMTLSGQRTKWVQGRDTTLRGEPVRLNPRTAEQYADEVAKMVRAMHLDISGQVEALFAKPIAKTAVQKTNEIDSLVDAGAVMDASISSDAMALTNKLADKWIRRFNSFGESWTKRMMTKATELSAKDLGRSMEKLSGGLVIDTNQLSEQTRDKMIASADQASSLIKSIAPQYTSAVKEAVSRSIVDSSSSFTQLQQTIHNSLQDKYKRQKNKAFNVAKDQMRKSYTAITEGRMKDLGVGDYVWRHAGGSVNPRDYHLNVLNGQKFSLDNPPVIDPKTGVKGKPGDLPFCSCYMEPVISFEKKD